MPIELHAFDTPNGRKISVALEEMALPYAVMDRRLAAQQFFADELSIADFAILAWAWRHPRHKVDLAEFPNVKRWYETLMARPGVRRGFEVKLS